MRRAVIALIPVLALTVSGCGWFGPSVPKDASQNNRYASGSRLGLIV